jgi:hypothetical protein
VVFAHQQMEPRMQPLAVAALISGVVMILGVTVTLIRTRHEIKSDPVAINRWTLHGSIPLAGAGLVLGVIWKGGGQSPATHDILYAVATTLFLAALLLAVAGAAAAHSGHGHSSGHP